jgi:RNA polymerase sigma-70 factor (ECF subfamily)
MLRAIKKNSAKGAASATLTDEQLVAAFVSDGDKNAFGLLFERYTHLVFGVCMKYLKNSYDAEDAVMGIFEKLMSDLQKHEVREFKNWLYRVAKNHCLMILRKQEVGNRANADILREKKQEFMEILFDGHHTIKEEYDEGILISLRDALSALKEKQKVCVELMYLEGKSYQDISEMTGYSLKEVKSYIQNGKRNLRNMLVNK